MSNRMIAAPRCGRICTILTFGCIIFVGLVVWTFWYGMNSDRDDIHPLLTQLIPAGHCACQTSTVFQCSSCLEPQNATIPGPPKSTWKFQYGRDDKNEGLSQGQCDVAFPGLYEDINLGKRYWGDAGNITASEIDKIKLVNGMTRAMIYNGQLYIIATKSKAEDHRRKIVAALSSIHRALAGYPERRSLPNLEFVFSIEDKAEDVNGVDHPIWVLARKATEEKLWLMPDFGYWAWDNMINNENNEIGPYDEVVEKAMEVEADLPFLRKEPKLVWRGKLSFAPKLRRALLDKARGHEWSDVKEVNWNVRQNYLTLEDHCKYQFIAHAEGRSYSASLKYRQACHSVPVIHKLQYIQHHHYLLVDRGPRQNFIEVDRDFPDLEEKMSRLLEDPTKALSTADNNVKTFRERYLTQAAEACYWRALWRGYAEVSEAPPSLWTIQNGGKKVKRGMRYETFMLLPSEKMLDFKIG